VGWPKIQGYLSSCCCPSLTDHFSSTTIFLLLLRKQPGDKPCTSDHPVSFFKWTTPPSIHAQKCVHNKIKYFDHAPPGQGRLAQRRGVNGACASAWEKINFFPHTSMTGRRDFSTMLPIRAARSLCQRQVTKSWTLVVPRIPTSQGSPHLDLMGKGLSMHSHACKGSQPSHRPRQGAGS